MRDARGRFLPGPDPDRHLFTRGECQKGFWLATEFYRKPSRVKSWLRSEIRRFYQGRPRQRRPA